MDKTFELIKKAEQDGDSIILSSKEQISRIKEELSKEIRNIENKYHNQINGLRDKLQQDEKDSIFRHQEMMEKEFIEETDSMRQAFLTEKKDLLLLLVGKVMNSNGNCNC